MATNIDAFADAFGFNLKSQPISCFWAEVVHVYNNQFEIGLPVIGADKTAYAVRACNANVGNRVFVINNNGQLVAIAKRGSEI